MTNDLTRLPDFARGWAGRRLAEHEAKHGRSPNRESFHQVADWLHSLPSERPKLINKLMRLTWDHAEQAQALWHQQIAKRAARAKSFDGDADAVQSLFEPAPGYRWVKVMTPEGLDYEGNAMGHCVGRGAYDEGCEILSLRDRNNLPHCTVEWHEDDKTVQQVQGRANQPVVSAYHGMVVALVEHLEAQKVDYAGKFDHVFASVNGTTPRLIHWSELKPNDRIAGDLSLAKCAALTHLPDGLSVGGVLDLNGCTALTHLPDGLSIGRDLSLFGCAALTHLPEELRVRGSLYLGGCTALTHLPDGLSIGRDLSLFGCTALTHLPEGLSVGRDLSLFGCTALTHLPEELSIGLDLSLFGCTALTHLPEELRVVGSLYLGGCTALTHLPEGLRVGGALNLTGCTALTHLPEGLSVGGAILGTVLEQVRQVSRLP